MFEREQILTLNIFSCLHGALFYGKIHQKFTKIPIELVYILCENWYNGRYGKYKEKLNGENIRKRRNKRKYGRKA